jgi:hypothetical protein
MDNVLKEKIRASMKDLLVARGWPDKLSNDQIIHMLPDLYKKLETEGLLKDLQARGFNYQQFVNIALQSRAKADAMEHMAQFFRRR